MSERIEGRIQIAAAAGARGAFNRRFGAPLWVYPLMLAVGVGIGLLGVELDKLARRVIDMPHFPFGIMFGLIVLLWPIMRLYRRLIQGRYRRLLAERGVTGPLDTSFKIEDEALVYVIGGVTKTFRWSVVSELMRAQGWWILVAQGEPVFMAARMFEAPEAERAWVGALLAHMDTPARA